MPSMSLQPDHRTAVSKAETAFCEAFDPSALRKSRYPALIAEIQRWLATNRPHKHLSLCDRRCFRSASVTAP